MPKKRASFQSPKPSSPAHPSLASSSKAVPPASALKNSVNERLQNLRLSQKPEKDIPLNLVSAPPTHTSHPSVQNVLQLPQSAPPRPRPGLRVRGGRRGPAGPPPPGSWLQKMTWKTHRQVLDESATDKPVRALPGTNLPRRGTLLEATLKALARHWEWHLEYDGWYLATIPVSHKEVLLHYLALEGSGKINVDGLEVLLCDNSILEDATGAEGFARLDLARAIGKSITFQELKPFFTAPVADEANRSLKQALPDSWDASPSSSTMLSLPKFHALTHLSLSRPGPSVTWPAFLRLAPNLTSLTHLSLAYWPTPTITPNSSTAFAKTPSGEVSYSATNFYSAYDNDFGEAASILRRLSKHTICLQWLDLTGCWPWVKCLGDRQIDYCGAWAGLGTLRMGQEDVPDSIARIVQRNKNPAAASDFRGDFHPTDASKWIDREMDYDDLAKQIKDRIKDLLMARDAATKMDEVVAERLAYDDEWGAQIATCRQPGSRTEGLEIESANDNAIHWCPSLQALGRTRHSTQEHAHEAAGLARAHNQSWVSRASTSFIPSGQCVGCPTLHQAESPRFT